MLIIGFTVGSIWRLRRISCADNDGQRRRGSVRAVTRVQVDRRVLIRRGSWGRGGDRVGHVLLGLLATLFSHPEW